MITHTVIDAVATVTIDDPERRNPLSIETMGELADVMHRTGTDDEVRVVVVTGAGDRAFSAGGDLSGGFVDSPLPDHQSRAVLADLFRAMRSNPKPIVGRINGVALGGGFGVAAACDITIAADHAKFGTPEINLGLWPMMISSVLLPLVPRKQLLEMMLIGRVVDAIEARELGIVTRVVPAVDLDATVLEIVDQLRSKSPAAIALGKSSFYAMEGMDLDTALDYLHIGLTAVSFTEDAAEGVQAFLEKRPAEWKGR
ncbi:MAG: enoyl-CoA hydratase/isomerase family protein [Acidimicrobiia bacterium]|nr:MAG: enoyl-CoA hydratase/isomerase family protein [Acidimicrobiia bacterium]